MSVSSDPYSGPHRDRPAAGTRSGLTVEALANAAWQVLAAAGAASIVLGVLVLVWPHVTLAVVGILFGIYLLASGVFQIAGAFGNHVPGALRAVGFVSGAICIMLGLICFRGAAESTFLLGLWIGFGWLLQGVMLTAVALSTEGLPARGWQLFLGVITAAAGIVLIVAPFHSLTVLTVVAGIWLLVLGATGIVHAFQLRSLTRSLSGSLSGS
ncbi:HdeD family acid-resistance protein [Streptacidiphilus carbonis]|uniref:HdeD family acid-resistance protein n=1 Tax=Streptacidiphilus carbonis TaxID=105422 RepID=UPI0005A6FA57|nr:HdeD family acid-resistance protein [Streptacidiphilus carbonis]